MNPSSQHSQPDFPLSTKDTFLLILSGFSGLLGFALSFSLFQPEGRPYLFMTCALLCLACLAFAEKKKEIALGTLGFILLRVIWSAFMVMIQHL